jgi:uncharacterized protein (DUF1778 family)
MQSKIPKPEKETNLCRIAIRCTVEEIKWLNAQAKKYGLTRTAFVKRKAFNAPLSLIPR